MKTKYLLSIIIMLLCPLYVNAASVKTSISCKTAAIGGTATCSISGTVSGGSVSSISTKIKVSGAGSFKGFTPASGWSGEGANGNIDLYTDTNKTSTFSIGTLTYKANSAGNIVISLSNGTISDADFNESSFSGTSKSIKINEPTTNTTTKVTPNTTFPTTTSSTTTTTTTLPTTTTTTTQVIDLNAPLTLTSISVGNYEVTEDNGIFYATVGPEVSEVLITAESHPGITIYGVGKRWLADGKNLVEITLVNAQNKQATYNLIITKPNPDGVYDTTLARLEVVGYKLSFEPNKEEYNVSVPFNINEVYVLAEGTDDVVINGDGIQTVSKGKNDIYIKVSYGNLASKTYVIHITKSYSSIIMLSLIGGLTIGLIVSIYVAKVNKKAALNKVINEKNKVLADQKTQEKSNSIEAGISLNGQNVVGIGLKPVTPTLVSENITSTPEQKVVSSTSAITPNNEDIKPVEPQVKIVRKTVIPVHTNVNQTKTETSSNNQV